MKPKSQKFLPVMLAGILQVMPFLRTALPALEFAGTPTGSLIMRWVAGGVAFFGYHAISSASSISISPPTATIGQAYAGTLTYSGSHSSQVSSMKYSGTCLGSTTLAPGLTISYGGGYTASITGTPTGSATTTNTITITVYDGSGCPGGGLQDTRSYAFTIQTNPVVLTVPTISASPQSLISQVGADALFSGGATGNPKPTYYWKQGTNALTGANTNSLLLPAVQFTNAGVYSMFATNSQGQANAACWLSVALTPGSNILGYHFTNYVVAGNPLVMNSWLTNVPAGVTTYAWQYTHVNTGVNTSNLTLTAANVIPSKSGIYSINFNSTVSTNIVVSNQVYDSYWSFGFLPGVTNQPTGGTVPPGTNFTFNATVTGTTPTVLWYQNGTNLISSQTLSSMTSSNAAASSNVSLTLSNVTAANSGTYTAVVTNFWGTTVSSNAVLNVQSALPPPPVLQGSASGGQFTLSFPSVVSDSYTVDYKTNITDPVWTELTNFIAGDTNSSVTDSLTNSPQRYYRVTAP
jgi:hypothetical protein